MNKKSEIIFTIAVSIILIFGLRYLLDITIGWLLIGEAEETIAFANILLWVVALVIAAALAAIRIRFILK